MTRRRRRLGLAVIAVAVAAIAWWGVAALRAPDPGAPSRLDPRDPGAAGGAEANASRGIDLPFSPRRTRAEVVIAGRVIEVRQQVPVGNVEVVFRGGTGDRSARSGPDGAYTIQL